MVLSVPFLGCGVGDCRETYASPAGHAGVPGLVYCLVGPVFHPGQSPTLLNSRVRRCEILEYIKSGLSCLFAYQFRQSIVWTRELAINVIWKRLAGPI